MADDQIAVELSAKVDGLTSGLTEAVAALKEAVESMKGDLHDVAESGKETEGLLEKLVSIETFRGAMEAFNFLKERAEEAFEFLKSGFESTIGKAEEFGLSNAKFAAVMGTSEETAAGLSAALRGAGSSSEEYTGIAERLQMKVNTNEKSMEELGIKTRDANGQILSGRDLMNSAISTMETYKSGADQNAFAVEVFGKRAADVYNIMRVGDEQIQHQIDIFNEMGVTMTGSGSDAAKLEDALNDLHTMVDALGIKIGQELLPTAQGALEWMGTEGLGFAKDLAVGIAELAKAIALWAEQAFQSIAKVMNAGGAVIDFISRVSKINDEMDAASAIDPTRHSVDALKDSWGHFTNAMKLVVGGPLEDAKDGIDQQGTAADNASSAVGHLSDAWDKLLEGFGKIGQGDIAEQLGAVTGGLGGAAADLDNDPLVAALSKQNPYKPASIGSKKFVAPKTGGKKDNSAEEEIQDAEKLALAKEQLEEQTNAHLLAMGQESESAFLAQSTKLENEKYQIQLGALNKEAALGGQTKAQHQKILDEIQLLEVTHQGALAKIQQEGETQQAALAKEQLANFIRSDDERLKEAKANLSEQVAEGKLSALEKDNLEISFTQTVKREELARLDANIATLTQGTKPYEEAIKQREQLEKKFTADLKAENATRRKDVEASVKEWVGPMTSSFTTAINSMITEGKSFGDAMKQMGKSLESALLGVFEKIAQNWLEMQITNAIVAKTSATANATTQITSEAAIAMAAAFADSATLGPVGLAAAPGAAAAAGGTVMSFIGLASAAGGMLLDRDQLVFAHQGEQVLPRHLSEGIQSMIANGNTGGGGDSNTTLHYAPTINAPAAKGLDQLLREQPATMLAWIAQKNRDGSFKSRPGQ